jgi:hypothetical protein
LQIKPSGNFRYKKDVFRFVFVFIFRVGSATLLNIFAAAIFSLFSSRALLIFGFVRKVNRQPDKQFSLL